MNIEIFKGTTVNERLYLSGMLSEFENALKSEKRENSYKILRDLEVDKKSIISIVG